MKITVIGHWGAFPAEGGATSGYLLQAEDKNILIDCGSGVLSDLQRYLLLEKLDAVILSHYHGDHIADLHCLQYATMIDTQLGKRTDVLPIYGHEQDQEQFAGLTFQDYCKGYSVSPESTLEIGPFHFRFVPTTHPVYCLAMEVSTQGKKLFYTADTEWDERLLSFSEKADILLCEANLYRELKGKVQGHLTGEEAGVLASSTKAKRLILTHLPHHGEHQTLIQEAQEHYDGPVELAYGGMVVQL